MSALPDRFRALEAEVAQLPRPSAAEVRGAAERRRRNGRITWVAAGLALVLGGAALTQIGAGGGDRLEPIVPSPGSPTASSSAAVSGSTAWLPTPWRLESSTTYTWAAGTSSTYRFCGDAQQVLTPTAVVEQRLGHPSGRKARLLTMTPEGENPVNLFKYVYASCLADGAAASIGGPRNVWAYGGAHGAAEVVGGALWLVEVTSASPQPATRADAEAALDAWTADAPRLGADGPQLVPHGHVVVVRADGSVSHVDAAGRASALPDLPADIGEPDAIVVDPDGELVMVSAVKSDDDDPSLCVAVTLQLTPDGRWHQVLTGASLALSADGRRLAYFGYGTVDGYCRRTTLVVRELDTGAENGVVAFDNDDGPLHGTPPEWPVSWSPDGTRVAHVMNDGVVVTDVSKRTTSSSPTASGTRSLAPVWLPDGTLAVLHGCCIGDGSMRDAATGRELFAVPGPVRSVRVSRSGEGVWLTVEEQPLLRWDGTTLHRLPVDALLVSG